MSARIMCRFVDVQNCRWWKLLSIALSVAFIISCSPSPSDISSDSSDQNMGNSANSDSVRIAQYNYDRLIRYNDSVAAQQYADSKRRAQPVKPMNSHRGPEKKIFYFYDDWEVYPCQLETADTAVHGITLSDIASSIAVLGREWNLIEDNADMPHQNYSNAHGSQFLTCFFHYGGGKYQYSEFQVSRSCDGIIAKTLSDEAFVTGNGIQLGLSKDSVISIMGSCYITDTFDGHLVLKYVAEDYDHSPFLRRWNYPKYYAWYEFSGDKLIRFRFGFEYP
jgi:hypothetical protein